MMVKIGLTPKTSTATCDTRIDKDQIDVNEMLKIAVPNKEALSRRPPRC